MRSPQNNICSLFPAMNVHTLLGCLLMTLFMGQSCTDAAADDKTARTGFLEQYEPHASKLEAFYADVRAKLRTSHESPNGPSRTTSIEAKFNLSSYLLDARTIRPDREGTRTSSDTRAIEGRNPRYNFTLVPKGDDRYVVSRINLHLPNEPSALCFLTFPIADYQFSKKTYLQMAKDEAIEFLEFKDQTWENNAAKKLRVRLTVRYGLKKERATELIVAYFFSPADGWVCRGLECYEANAPSTVQKYIYTYTKGKGKSHRDPSRTEFWLSDAENGGKFQRISFTDITEYEHCTPFPVTDFTLSAYGLPEPEGIVWEKGSRWYLWFLGTAAILLGAGWYFWRRVQRRSALIARPEITNAGGRP